MTQTLSTREPSIVEWLQLIRAEYVEIPGLHLTGRQVERMWGLDTLMCTSLLDALVDTGFLRCTIGGAYIRVGAGY